MTDGAAEVRSTSDPRRAGRVAAVRFTLTILSLVLLVLSVVPPLATYARRFEFAEALQFCLLAIVVPVFVASGAPGADLGLAAVEPAAIGEDGAVFAPTGLRPIDRLALRRRHHAEPWRAVVVAALYLGVVVLWRIPLTVDALARHGWLALVEAVTLVPIGVTIWIELVESPPLTPRLSRPHRVAMSAVVMWVIWVLAYLVGLAHGAWYHGFDHTVATGMSVSADQQLTTGVIWMVSGLAFVPVVFWNLIYWLQSEEDPDDELHRLIRDGACPRPHGRSGGGSRPDPDRPHIVGPRLRPGVPGEAGRAQAPPGRAGRLVRVRWAWRRAPASWTSMMALSGHWPAASAEPPGPVSWLVARVEVEVLDVLDGRQGVRSHPGGGDAQHPVDVLAGQRCPGPGCCWSGRRRADW